MADARLPVDDEYLAAAVEAAERASDVHRKYVGDVREVSAKSPQQLVTEADLEAGQAVAEYLTDRYPDHGYVGEERGGDDDAARVWHVDPIDGTTNYVRGLGSYAVSVALVADGRREVGVVHHTPTDETYAAVRGRGAYRNGEPLSVTGTTAVRDALFATGFSAPDAEDDELMGLVRELLSDSLGIRRRGSAAAMLCRVAEGTFDGFVHKRLRTWDVAAATLVVEEAGGTVTDLAGNAGDADVLAGDVLATNGLVHDDLLYRIQ